jgi:signal peptidase I
MDGNSMLPTIKNGDRFLVTQGGAIDRGDVVEFLYPKDETRHFLKRVIGMPGERVEVRKGKVFVDDKELVEPYIDQMYNRAGTDYRDQLVPEDSYYLMGDNRDNFSDSRIWGTVKRESITGKYYAIYYSASE